MESQKIDLTIVLATLNEIENLPQLCFEIDSILNKQKIKYQLSFVDDNSIDGTREFIRDYCAKNPSSKYIFNNIKQSPLIARYQGIKSANGKYVIIMDADLQHPPSYLMNIYNALLKNYDIVIASRYCKGGSPGNRKIVRGIISRTATFLSQVWLRSSRNINDPLSGYFGFKNGLKLDIKNEWRGYEIGIFLRANNSDLKIKEIPYKFAEREKGKSKVTSSPDFVKIYLIELLRAKKVEIMNYRKLAGSTSSIFDFRVGQ